jgi:tetratricopeptide (TPR) repeat protein
MKRAVVTALLVAFGAMPLMAGPAAELKSARKSLHTAMGLGEVDTAAAEISYKKAFHALMNLTHPDQKKKQRENAFVLASKCLHPGLYTEVRMAIDTYLSLFPQGRYRVDILQQKALLEFAEGNFDAGQEILDTALALTKSRTVKNRLQGLRLNGYLRANKFRTAEQVAGEHKKGAPSRVTRRNFGRFEDGNRRMSQLLEDWKRGGANLDLLTIQKGLGNRYFAESAPELALVLLAYDDLQEPMVHGVEVDLLGETRATYHHLASFQRYARLKSFLSSYPEANPYFIWAALTELRNLALHEMKNGTEAAKWLERMSALPGNAEKVDIEKNLEILASSKPADDKSILALEVIASNAASLPYDNGWYPTMDLQWCLENLVQFYLVKGRKDDARPLVARLETKNTYRSIPLRLLMMIAVDQRMQAHEYYQTVKDAMTPRDQKLVESFLFPLYKFTDVHDMKILAAMILSERYPVKAVDILLEHVTGVPKPGTLDHALGALAELYQGHRSYMEAQSVWATLIELFPRSTWTR